MSQDDIKEKMVFCSFTTKIEIEINTWVFRDKNLDFILVQKCHALAHTLV